MNTDPLTIAFLVRGCFTKELAKLEKGNEIYFRGPHGKEVKATSDDIVLVGGGSGIAGIYLFAKRHKAQIFAGARDSQHLLPFQEISHDDIYVATNDGSLGLKGTVSDLLRKHLKKGSFFVNCGPIPMIEAVMPIERQFASPENIYSAIEYTTRCGRGLCGSCADEKGLRRCAEGPFVRES
jgi:dihydroorotate dehydrogenase (NAD+) catalytic subunit